MIPTGSAIRTSEKVRGPQIPTAWRLRNGAERRMGRGSADPHGKRECSGLRKDSPETARVRVGHHCLHPPSLVELSFEISTSYGGQATFIDGTVVAERRRVSAVALPVLAWPVRTGGRRRTLPLHRHDISSTFLPSGGSSVRLSPREPAGLPLRGRQCRRQGTSPSAQRWRLSTYCEASTVAAGGGYLV
jgi:hypothetical protein